MLSHSFGENIISIHNTSSYKISSKHLYDVEAAELMEGQKPVIVAASGPLRSPNVQQVSGLCVLSSFTAI